jgi:tetratricopeptide (TPR) repeat protein
LRIAGTLLRHRPAWTPHYLADLLRDEHRRLAALADGDHDLQAVLDLSYVGLDEPHRLLFRRLALIPGADLDALAAAALLDTDAALVVGLLEDLVDDNLLIEHSPGRYRLHDLIRVHARTLVDGDPLPAREAALDRLLDHYQHTAGRADELISRIPRRPSPEPVAAHAPVLPDADAARAWLRTERPNLLAAARDAAGRDQHERTIALIANMATLLRNDGPWSEALALHTEAVATAGRLRNQAAQAAALVQLGGVRNLTGNCQAALDAVEHANKLYQELGDPLGQANALTQLGEIRGFVDDYRGAVHDLEQALHLYRELDNPLGQANALAWLGKMRRYAGDLPGAIPSLEQALSLYRRVGERDGEGTMLMSLGNAQRLTGDFAGAARNLEQALRLFDHLDHHLGRANALCGLGELRHLAGDYPDAARLLEQGLRLYHELGNRMGQANAQVWLGSLRQSTGDLTGAAQLLQAAVDTFRSLGSRRSEAWALNPYAAVIAATGDLRHAKTLYLDALRLARATGQHDDEAVALEGLAENHLSTGETEPALAHLAQALEVFQHLRMAPDAERVRARLADLTRGVPELGHRA